MDLDRPLPRHSTPGDAAASAYGAYRAWSSETLPEWDELPAQMQRSWEFVALGYREVSAVMLREPERAWPVTRGRRMVYFIRAENGRIKIGSSTDPNKRLAEMQVGSPEKLALMAAYAPAGDLPGERRLHRRFAQYRVRGEWFDPNPELLRFIRAIRTPAASVG